MKGIHCLDDPTRGKAENAASDSDTDMEWTVRSVPIKFQLSDKTLYAHQICLDVTEVALDVAAESVIDPQPPAASPKVGSEGFLIRALPVTDALPILQRKNAYLRYVPLQYRRYYIDMKQSFAEYLQHFSSRTRSTLNRKVKKYEEYVAGPIEWKVYKTVTELREFFHLGRQVSAKTYQENLLDAGLPDSLNFSREMEALASRGEVRAFLLFDGGTPVSYLYCPIRNGVVIYQYLGYDPKYGKLSVGTVLQWLALQHLFAERCFRLFDFTEGESEHKRLFATHSLQCANVYFLRDNISNRLFLSCQIGIDWLSNRMGNALDRVGMKSQIKKLIRFGRV